MGLVNICKPGSDVTDYRFDPEKIMHCVDLLTLSFDKKKKKTRKCLCSKECINETIRFLNVLSEAWDDAMEAEYNG